MDRHLLGLSKVTLIELQHNNLNFPNASAEHLELIKIFNLSNNEIGRIGVMEGEGQFLNTLYDMRGNPLTSLSGSNFSGLRGSQLLVDDFATCCFINDNITCISTNPRQVYLTCKRMLSNGFLRVSMWSIGITALIFNLAVVYSRLITQSIAGQNILISSLALSDFVMGLDMVILATVDVYYSYDFPSFSNVWRTSVLCKTAAALSILSSEASVFFVVLISFDRYLGITYPFSDHVGLGTTRTWISVSLCWLTSITLSVLPLAIQQYIPDIIELSEVCIGIPILRKSVTTTEHIISEVRFKEYDISYAFNFSSYLSDGGRLLVGYFRVVANDRSTTIHHQIASISGYLVASYFSIVIFIGVNLLCFIMIPVFYCLIFKTATESSKSAGNSTIEREIRMAIKMSAVVLTDFCCWVPLAFVCILVQCGLITVNPEMYAWTVGLILPLNSSINPFLYTLAFTISDYIKHRSAKEDSPRNTIGI